MDCFNGAFVSALAFRERFKLYGGLDFKLRKMWEEVYEFFQAVERYTWVLSSDIPVYGKHEQALRDNTLAEFSDIIYAGFSPLIEMGFTLDEINQALYTKTLKNDAKTLETYEVRDGFVRKLN